MQHLGDEVCTALELRQRIRRHPFLATGLGALLGFLGGPLVLPAFKQLGRLQSLPRLVMTSLRFVGARL